MEIREEWIPGKEGEYAITEEGRVFSYKKEKRRELKTKTTNGYHSIMIDYETYYLHQLLYRLFIGDAKRVYFKDNDKKNISLSNLCAYNTREY